MGEKIYAAIDLKSFYASVECRERKLDPLLNCLVVADESRTEKTICLAVSPALKKCGIPGRPRLFEVIQTVGMVNAQRRVHAPGGVFTEKSVYAPDFANPEVEIDYIVARPRMALYMAYSTKIYDIYLRFFAPEDIIIYSVDEVFIDLSGYLKTYHLSPEGIVRKVLKEVLKETGITATAGIGTNLYLAKIAMDIMAKKMPADEDGVCLAHLTERTYREQLWHHKPLTDFWRVGKGYETRLNKVGLETMGDIARCSLGGPGDFHNEDLLYDLFGVNAELLIDHAWGFENCRMEDVKNYKPETKSLSMGQVLKEPTPEQDARLIVWEMADQMALDLMEKGYVTDSFTLSIGYDRTNLERKETLEAYRGSVTTDAYGRRIPKSAHGSIKLEKRTCLSSRITEGVMRLFDRISKEGLYVRRLTLDAMNLKEEGSDGRGDCEQMSLFTDVEAMEKRKKEEEKEMKLQKAMLEIKERYGKNALLKGNNLLKGGTMRERNEEIGGHKA